MDITIVNELKPKRGRKSKKDLLLALNNTNMAIHVTEIQGQEMEINKPFFLNENVKEDAKENAQENYDLAIRVLHFSPEPRVAQRAIECLKLLGRNQDADRLSKHLKMPTLNPPNQTIDNQDLHKLFNFH